MRTPTAIDNHNPANLQSLRAQDISPRPLKLTLLETLLLYLIGVCIGILVVVHSAEAATVRFVYVDSPDATYQQQKRYTRQALGLLSFAKLREVRERRMRDVVNVNSYPGYDALDPWAALVDRRRADFTVVLLPKSTDGARRYFSGTSTGICDFHGVAIARVGALGVLCGGECRNYNSTLIAHELAHLLGARHKQGAQVMSYTAGQYGDKPLGFLRESVGEIARCIGGGQL